MEGVCSAQVQAQNEHSRGLKTGSALALQAAFADINIAKDRPVYSIVSSHMTPDDILTALKAYEVELSGNPVSLPSIAG
jgi:hypothetical protein